MKKFLKNNGIKILTVVLFFSSIPFNISLADKEQEKANEIMKEWSKMGILAGDGAGNFRPNDPVSRAEFMVLTNRALKFENKTVSIKSYRDIKKNDWYYDDIEKAVSAGYISGISKDKMSPHSKITNQEVYAAISKLTKENNEVDLNGVLDKESISKWAENGIRKSIANGYVLSENGKINPKEYTSRADVIVILDRVMTNQRVISFPGTYTIKSAKTISVLSDKVILKDTVIDQDLILGANVTQIIIQNSQIKGKLIKNNIETKVTKDELSKVEESSEIKEEITKQLDDKELKDGIYEGIAQGYGGQMLLRVTVKNRKITDITFLSHNETGSYLELAERVTKKIIETGGTDKVDTISGATVSSKAIINAVNDALSQAKGKTQRAGQTPDSYEQISTGKKKGKTPTEPNKIDYSKKNLKDGVYKGSATGYGGKITVSVDVKKSKISDVSVDSHSETGSYYKRAEVILKKITEKNGTNVDTISGATVTSKGILSAVEDALLKASGGDKVEKIYADGTWYGQGRGHYSKDHDEFETRKTATEAVVKIENGKILSTKLEYHGDDSGFVREKGYELIENSIIKNNGTEGLLDIFARKDESEPIYDAVSGATNSARGFVNAIEDALSRSEKFKKDSVSQEVRSINLDKHDIVVINYEDEVDLSELKLSIKYMDGKEKLVKLKDLEENGIECNLPIKFIPKPDNNNYEERKNLNLVFTHEKSTSKHVSELQATRKILYKKISRIEFETADGNVYEVPITEEFRYRINLNENKLNGIKAVKVFDIDNRQIEIDSFGLDYYDLPELRIELKKIGKPKQEEPVQEVYRFNTFDIELRPNAEFDKNSILSFKIKSYPEKKEYFKGEKLDLKGLSIIAKDSNYIEKIIPLNELEFNGFVVEPSSDSNLDEIGNFEVRIKHNNSKEEEGKFDISVKEKSDLPNKIELIDTEGNPIETIFLIDGKRTYSVKLSNIYKNQDIKSKVYTEKGDEMIPHEVVFTPGTNIMKIYFTEDKYAFLGLRYKD